jgi:capsular exopolysaccharide synthesis family protein
MASGYSNPEHLPTTTDGIPGGGEHLPSTFVRESIPTWEGEEIHLRDYLEIIIRRKWMVFGVLALVFVSTLIFTLTATKIYKADGSIEVTRESPKITKFEEVTSAEVNAREFYETQVSLLKSQALIQRVSDRLDLPNHPVIKEALFEEVEQKSLRGRLAGLVKTMLSPGEEETPKSAIPDEILDQQRLLRYLDENLAVSLRRNSTLINVSFTSPDRHLSRDFVNTIGDEFIRWKMDQKLEASQIAREFLTKQIDRAKINLEGAEEEMNRFAKQAGIVSLDSKRNSVFAELEELNAALARAEAGMIAKKAIYNQAVNDGPRHLPQVLQSPVIGDLKAQHARLQSEYEELTTTFKDEYPAVKTLKSRMESIEQRALEEAQNIYKSIENEYKVARKQVDRLRERVAAQKELALNLNERATQYKIMAREVETNKGIYQSLLERAKEIESMVGVSSSNIHIVDRSSLPIFPFKPKVRLNLLLAIVVGLMGGIGLAFVMEYFADTITNPEQISERFQIPILGVVPQAKSADYTLDRAFITDPRAPMSESIRTTKVSIQLSGAEEHARSFLITSTSPGEGKTTLAVNLAMAFSGSDEKVLLIDSDLRKPRIHKIFDTSGNGTGPGLSSYLAGVVKENFIRESGIENLWILTAGPIPPNPVELLASSRFADLMVKASQRFDRVILDGPPHHGFADILVLSRQVGGVVLVSSIGETTREALRHFKKGILNVRGTILGCIINKVNVSKRYGYRSYYKYYQAYNYEYGEDKKKRSKLLGRG